MVLGLFWDMQLPAGWELEHIILPISRSSGVFQLLWVVFHLYVCCFAVRGFQSRRDGVCDIALPKMRTKANSTIVAVLTKGRKDEAWAITSRLYGDDTSANSGSLARTEFHQMFEQVQADAAAWSAGGNRQLFMKPSYRKRMWIGFFIQYASQSTGANVIYGASVFLIMICDEGR
jgi:hypothetical protein